jgi:methionine aminopeptidase
MAIIIKSKNDLRAMRKSGRIAQRVLHTIGEAATEGTTPRQLDALARRLLEELGAAAPFSAITATPQPSPSP